MTTSGRSSRRTDLEPLSARGKAAAITTGACLLIAGTLVVVSSWAELTCPLGGEAGRALCQYTAGVGGLFVLLGLIAAAAGLGILVSGIRRPYAEIGPSGWTWGEGLLVAFAGVTIAMLIPTYHCPAGYTLTPVFHVCASADEILAHPPTWLAWKVASTSM